jgi:hypothetical protein
VRFRSARSLALFALGASLVLAAPAGAAPFVFPMPDGSQQVRDERDVAPYLAAWKANALRRARAVAQPATANQLQYDARWYDLNLSFTPVSNQV